MDESEALQVLLGIQQPPKKWYKDPDTLLPLLFAISVLSFMIVAGTTIFLRIQGSNEIRKITELQEIQCDAFADVFHELGRLHDNFIPAEQPAHRACEHLNPNPREAQNASSENATSSVGGSDDEASDSQPTPSTADDRRVRGTDSGRVQSGERGSGDRDDDRPKRRPSERPSPRPSDEGEEQTVIDRVVDCLESPLDC